MCRHTDMKLIELDRCGINSRIQKKACICVESTQHRILSGAYLSAVTAFSVCAEFEPAAKHALTQGTTNGVSPAYVTSKSLTLSAYERTAVNTTPVWGFQSLR